MAALFVSQCWVSAYGGVLVLGPGGITRKVTLRTVNLKVCVANLTFIPGIPIGSWVVATRLVPQDFYGRKRNWIIGRDT